MEPWNALFHAIQSGDPDLVKKALEPLWWDHAKKMEFTTNEGKQEDAYTAPGKQFLTQLNAALSAAITQAQREKTQERLMQKPEQKQRQEKRQQNAHYIERLVFTLLILIVREQPGLQKLLQTQHPSSTRLNTTVAKMKPGRSRREEVAAMSFFSDEKPFNADLWLHPLVQTLVFARFVPWAKMLTENGWTVPENAVKTIKAAGPASSGLLQRKPTPPLPPAEVIAAFSVLNSSTAPSLALSLSPPASPSSSTSSSPSSSPSPSPAPSPAPSPTHKPAPRPLPLLLKPWSLD